MKHSLLLLLLVACTPMAPAASSNAVLTPPRTWVIVAKPAREASLDVVRLFQARGYQLVDLQENERGSTLRFKGERKTVAEQVVTGADVLAATANALEAYNAAKEKRPAYLVDEGPTIETYELGSVFYVRVEPRGETMTSLAMMGRPTRNGVEACTADAALQAPCETLESGPAVHAEIAGIAEAETINSVFAVLRLEGSVVAPDVRRVEASDRCWQRRREVQEAASRVSSERARANILRTAPRCDDTLANR